MNEQEGVIKFNYKWEKKPLPSSLDIHELVSYRNKLYKHKLIGADKDGIGYGNISVMHKPAGTFIISASDTGSIKTASKYHFSLVHSVSAKKNFVSCSGMKPASSESMTHDIIYKLSPEIKCVIHVHSLKLWNKLLNKVPTTPKSILYGTPELAYEVKRLWEKKDLKEKRILVMGGHKEGLIVFGESIAAAYNLLMDYFQQLSKVSLLQ